MKKLLFIFFGIINFTYAEVLVEVLNKRKLETYIEKTNIGKRAFFKFNSTYFNSLVYLDATNEQISELNNSEVIRTEKVFELDGIQKSISPNSKISHTNDPLIPYQWGVFNEGQEVLRDIDDINSEKSYSVKGKDINLLPLLPRLNELMKRTIRVAVLDSGIDIDHPDLVNAIYVNSEECDGTNIPFKPDFDNDNNGLKGDCKGWNFTSKGEGDNRPYDDKGHGTHVAGIIAASIDNNLGVMGSSKKVKIIPIKVLKKRESLTNSSGVSSFTDRIAKGVLYAINMKADVINMSLGWPKSLETKHLREAINEALNAGITIVAAAGNNNINRPIFPCSYKGVICVGSTTIDGSVAAFSNFGGHVDVLAPGEQILSTNPLKFDPDFFNVKGYEVKNGTSQSAPFVSSLAALLKGSLPKITNEEVRGRIICKSQSKLNNNKNTLAGLISFKDSVFTSPQICLVPDFKDLQYVIFRNEFKKFKFNIGIENLWRNTKATNVTFSFRNKNIQLRQNDFQIDSLRSKESINFELIGQISDLQEDADVILDVKIQSGDKVFNYAKTLTFVRMLDADNEILTKTFNFNDDLDFNKVATNIGGKIVSKLMTVTDKFRVSKTVSYFSTSMNRDNGNFVLNLFNQENNSFNLLKAEFPNVKRILSFYKIDLNYDGKLDFFLRTLNQVGEDQYISYMLLDQNLEHLFENSVFKFVPEAAVLNAKTLRFVPVDSSYGRIATPLFIEDGLLPQNEQNPSVWIQKDFSKRKRVYYLDYDFKNREIKTKVFDNYIFSEKLKDSLQIDWDENTSILGVKDQSIHSYKNGLVELQLSIGEGFMRNYYRVKIGTNFQYSIEKIDLKYITLDGSLRTSLIDISDGNPVFNYSTVLVGMHTNTLAQNVLLDNDAIENKEHIYVYDHPRKQDHLLGVLPFYKDEESLYAFYQSKGNLVLSISDFVDGKQDNFTFPINRVSFIPGSVFNEIPYPVVVKKEGRVAPAFYIDATALHAGHVYVVTGDKSGLHSPLKYNVFIPKDCTTMNPANFENKLHYSFLCMEVIDEKKQFVLKYLPIGE